MKLFAVLFTLAVFASAAHARHVSLVAGNGCKTIVQTCVQGEEQAIMNFVRFSKTLPCKREHMKVVPGTCAGQGFTSLLGMLTDAQVAVFARLVTGLESKEEGEVCWKDIQFRGIGRFAKNCTAEEERQFGFCFKKCAEGSAGEGPLCFSECNDPFGVSVGALCCKTKGACAGTIAKESLKFTYDVIKTIFDGNTNPIKVIGDLKKIFRDAKDLNFPDCKNERASFLTMH